MSNKRILGQNSPKEVVRREKSATPIGHVKKPAVPTAHFHVYNSNSTCAICNSNLRGSHYNCGKCGLLLCEIHRPRFDITVSPDLEVVPYDQKLDISYSLKCCEICLYNSPGWLQTCNSLPTVVNKTKEFDLLRSKVSQGEQLDNLILERRIGKLTNWIAGQVQSSFPNAARIDYVKLRGFETKLCKWNMVDQCEICQSGFGFFARKHHCRLCGKTVCGDLSRGCSMPIPLSMICEIMDELEISESLAKDDDNSIRICKCCRKSVFDKRVFNIQKRETSQVFKLSSNWKTIECLLKKEDLSKIKSNQQSQRIIGLFNRADSLSKEMNKLVLNNSTNPIIKRDEIQILINIQLMISEFIHDKLPIFRKSQEDKLKMEQDILRDMNGPKPIITKKEIRELREKLMVLNEQKFIVQNMQNDLKKQRKFDDLKTLDGNLNDLDNEINEIQLKLGDEAF